MLIRRIFLKLLNIIPLRAAISSLSGLITGFFILGLLACSSPFLLTKYLDGTGESDVSPAEIPGGSTIEITPENITLSTPSEFTFTATGGAPPYDYTVIVGPGSIDSSGLYSSGSGSGGTATIRVEDSLGALGEINVEVVATSNTGLWISPTSVSLMEGEVFEFNCGGGNSPYTYSIVEFDKEGSIIPGTGVFTAASPVDKEGAAVVQVDDGTSTAQAIVYIQNPAEGFSVTQTPPTTVIHPGDIINFTAVGASNPSAVKWKSNLTSDPVMPTPGVASSFKPSETGVALIEIDDSEFKVYRMIIVVDP